MPFWRQIAIVIVVLAAFAAGWALHGSRPATAPGTPDGAPGAADHADAAGRPGSGQGPGPGAGPPGQGARPGGFGGAGFANRPLTVITAEVGTQDDGIAGSAIGTVAATRSVSIYPQVTGVVTDVDFTPGSTVTEGQTLVHLADGDKKVAVQQAELNLDTARQALARTQKLAQSSNATTVAVDDAKNAVAKAEIDLKTAEIDLARYTIVAPFAGIVGLSDVTTGDLVTTQKALVTLDDMSTVTVSFSLPERASGLVAIGQAVSATTAAFPGQSFPGTISAIDSRVDPVTRSLAVQATLPNDANILKPGMALNVAMSFPGVTRPVVPSLAVQWDKAGSYVWKIVDATARRADVTIVGRRSGQVLVAGDGIAAGDHVVVEGLQRLREGSAVAEPGQGAGFGGPPGNRPPDNATAARPAGAT